MPGTDAIDIYMDEGGLHPGASCVCVAGYWATSHQWSIFVDAWQLFLSKVRADFHGSHNGSDFLRPYLFESIRLCGLKGLAVTINPHMYDHVASARTKSVMGNAYAFCATMCVAGIAETLADGATTQPAISVVLEDGQPNASYVKRILEAAMEEGRFGLKSVRLAEKSDTVALHPADFLAHCAGTWNQFWLAHLANPIKGNARVTRITSDAVEKLNEDWRQIDREKSAQKSLGKSERRFRRRMLDLQAQLRAGGTEIDLLDNTIAEKLPKTDFYLIVRNREGIGMLIPDTPEGWSEFERINSQLKERP